MRSHLSLLLALPCVALPFSHEPPAVPAVTFQDEEALDPSDWEVAVRHTFEDGRVRRAERQGAMGTSVLAPELGKVNASLLVDLRHDNQVSIVLGWAVPSKYKSVDEDLRVRFEDVEGETYVTSTYAGGGTAIQFASPPDVELAMLKGFELLYKKKAPWLRGK